MLKKTKESQGLFPDEFNRIRLWSKDHNESAYGKDENGELTIFSYRDNDGGLDVKQYLNDSEWRLNTYSKSGTLLTTDYGKDLPE